MPPRTLIPCPYSKSRICSIGSSQRFSTSRVGSITSPTSISTDIQIPPESPRFISIPRSVQEKAVYHPYIKGFLPVPRQIFPRNLKKHKTSHQYLKAATPEPQPSRSNPPGRPIDPLVAYKARQALHRRQNLRGSLVELSARKKRLDHKQASISWYKRTTNQRLQNAPPHDSEYFTAPSITLAMRPSRKLLQDPDRQERIAEKRAKTAMKQAEREDDRRYMLHTLYMNAASFITTAAELNAVVDEVFDNKDIFTNDSVRGENIWNLGEPETVQELLDDLDAKGRKTPNSTGSSPSLGEQRLDRIAEELTGGKL